MVTAQKKHYCLRGKKKRKMRSNTKSKYKHRQFHFSSVKQPSHGTRKHNKHKTNITPEMEKWNKSLFVRCFTFSGKTLCCLCCFFYVFLFRLSLIFESNLHERWVIFMNKKGGRRMISSFVRKAMAKKNRR